MRILAINTTVIDFTAALSATTAFYYSLFHFAMLENAKICFTYSQFHVSMFHVKVVELSSVGVALELLGLETQFPHKIQKQVSSFLALHLAQTGRA
jgi:hypothetical protein